jgi:hemolysin III
MTSPVDESSTGIGSAAVAALARPRLRGVLHQYAFVVFGVLGIALTAAATGTTESVAVAVFAASLAVAFAISAVYHRVIWTPHARELMRRLDHAGIFLLIAGTYTPYGLLVLDGAWRYSVLSVVWSGALVAVVQRLIWRNAPKWVAAVLAVALGWVGIVAFPTLVDVAGWTGAALLLSGGALYTLGALVYALRRPDPVPRVFGYHELFHTLTIAAAGVHFAAVAMLVL